MSYFDWLDAVIWYNFFKFLEHYEIDDLVNAFPWIERFVKILASSLMKTHFPTLYSDSDPYLRWQNRNADHGFTFTFSDHNLDPATIQLTCISQNIDRNRSGYIRTALCDGLAPPPGTDICIIFIVTDNRRPILVWLNMEDAINYYINNLWATSATDICERYNASLPDRDQYSYADDIPMEDEGLNAWLEDEHPTVPRPFTKEIVASHLRANASMFDPHYDVEIYFINLHTEESMYD